MTGVKAVFCKDCKHYDHRTWGDDEEWYCRRKQVLKHDVVDGTPYYDGKELGCWRQRNPPRYTWWYKYNCADYCGTEARYFEPKDTA